MERFLVGVPGLGNDRVLAGTATVFLGNGVLAYIFFQTACPLSLTIF